MLHRLSVSQYLLWLERKFFIIPLKQVCFNHLKWIHCNVTWYHWFSGLFLLVCDPKITGFHNMFYLVIYAWPKIDSQALNFVFSISICDRWRFLSISVCICFGITTLTPLITIPLIIESSSLYDHILVDLSFRANHA